MVQRLSVPSLFQPENPTKQQKYYVHVLKEFKFVNILNVVSKLFFFEERQDVRIKMHVLIYKIWYRSTVDPLFQETLRDRNNRMCMFPLF